MSDVQQETERGWLDRTFDRPPGWIFHVLLGLAVLVQLFAVSVPGNLFRPSLLSSLVVLVLFGTWVARLAGYLVARRAGRAEGSPWVLAVTPVVLLVAAALIFTNVPLQVRWAASKGAFEDRAAEVQAGETDGERPVELGGRYGTYDVNRVGESADGNAVVFFTSRGGLFEDTGFVYVDGDPDDTDLGLVGPPDLTSLGGGWYAFTAED